MMKTMKRAGAALCALVVAGSVAACAPKAADANAPVTELKIWDGYTQYGADSPLVAMYNACAGKLGIKLERTADQNSSDSVLQNAVTGNLPDLTILEYSYVPQFAKAGLLADNDSIELDTSHQLTNVAESGVYEGKMYGASLGFNSLALYYKPSVLQAAGIQKVPETWDELKDAAKKLTSGDQKGFGFSAANGEDGVHQFMPFFWGAGANLTKLDSPEANAALTYLSSFVKDGITPSDVVNWNQQDVRDQFMAGHLAMMLNGTWQLNDLDKAGTEYAVAPFPGEKGAANVPLGGEFIEAVKTGNAARQKKAGEFIQCLIAPDSEGMQQWAKGQTYLVPDEAGLKKQEEADSRLTPWVANAKEARSKVKELGPNYPVVSLALRTAIQSALTGKLSVHDALAEAQKSATETK